MSWHDEHPQLGDQRPATLRELQELRAEVMILQKKLSKVQVTTTDEWVARVVSQAPPLSEEQKNKLAVLLRPAGEAIAESRKGKRS